jgi:hypothetical protein
MMLCCGASVVRSGASCTTRSRGRGLALRGPWLLRFRLARHLRFLRPLRTVQIIAEGGANDPPDRPPLLSGKGDKGVVQLVWNARRHLGRDLRIGQ